MNRRNAMTHVRMITLVGAVLLTGCASDRALFARYDQPCPQKSTTSSMALASVTGVVDQPDLNTWEPAVYFGFDEARLSAGEKARLDRDLAVLRRWPKWQISVRGYADRIGGRAYNRKLSVRRLNNVVAYLRDHGLPASRIKAAALGDSMPILRNADRDQRVINRRVELMPLDADGRPLIVRAGAGFDDRFVPPAPVR